MALPVDPYLERIVAAVRGERRAVIIAPPGSGKTTRIPPALTALGKTILLQPRRVAARALTRRIAAEQGWSVGTEVGWQIRFERRFAKHTRLLVATEGILTARLQSDPLLSDFRVVILDEFHERSIHADLALALVKQAAESRDDLAVVVMSATIDPAPIARFLGSSVIEIDARVHPFEIVYRDVSMTAAIEEILRDKPDGGDVLCFLPGVREIEEVRMMLEPRSPAVEVHPLHGSLPVEAQELALAPSKKRKVILATNVAETSLTVEGITEVIDSGRHKVLRYDPDTAVDHLLNEQISRDSADQRAGRAGRIAPGRATRLWDERMILNPHREPEVRRVDLAATVLDIIAWGGDAQRFEWYERPPEHRIEAAVRLLERLGAISEGRITTIGEAIRRFPLHPRLARVLIAAGGAAEAVRACAVLSEDMRRAGSGDVMALRADERVVAELTQLSSRILGDEYRSRATEETVRRALLAGYPDRVAMRREPKSLRLLLSSGTGAVLARESGLHEGEFLVALDVSGGPEALVRIASVVERDWLVPTHEDVLHETVGDRVRATKSIWYDALLLREVKVATDPDEVRRLRARQKLESIESELLRRLAFAHLEVDWEGIVASTGDTSLPWDVRRKLERQAPERLDLPSGRTTKLEYPEDGSVVASVKLQELFGLADTPLIGPDRIPVTFALLSPGGRPVQITRDLRSFWDGGYQEVRKELRARYPKHPWPEDPWTAQATHRTKKR